MNYKEETLFNPAEIKTPSVEFYPIYSWVWNSPISKNLIIEQIDIMERNGIRGMYIIPEPPEFRPNSMVTYMTPDYLSDEFFDLVEFSVNYAKTKGMLVWLYDEGGWPSGAACGKVVELHPECCSKIIVESEVEIKAGEMYQPHSDILCAFTESFERIKVEYIAESDGCIYEYFVKDENIHLPCLLEKDAVDTFINLTYDGYKQALGSQFAKNCPVVFTDEAILHYPYVILDAEDFKNKTGFDFYEYLPAIFHKEVFGSNGEQFRISYMEYCGNKFADAYMKPVREWCNSNNVMLAGHMDGDHILSDYTRNVGNILKQLRYMDIPGVDVIWNQIYPGAGKNLLFPRMASSAANSEGKYYALTESFAVYGCGMTYDTMRYVVNAQAVRGINIINIMSMSSGTEGFVCHQFRPNFLLESPVTKFLKSFNEYIARISYMCSVGKPCRNTAVYLPLRDVWSQHQENEKVQRDFYSLCEELDKNYVDFDIIDDDFIRSAEQKNEKLCKGFAEYDTIYIPFCKYIPEEVSNILNVFSKNGGRVVSKKDGIVFYDSLIEAKDVLNQLRVSKRVTSDGNLIYMIFNEGTELYKEEVQIKCMDKRNVYMIDLYDGQLLQSNTKNCLRLESGEACFFICTDNDYPIKHQFTQNKISVYEMPMFNATIVEQFKIDNLKPELSEKNIFMGEVAFNSIIRDDFSGGIRYDADFEVKNVQGSILMDLGNINCCCTVYVNGIKVKSIFMPPFFVEIPPKVMVSGKNHLSVTIYNTAANVYASTEFENVPCEIKGPYHARTLELEKQSVKSLLSKNY